MKRNGAGTRTRILTLVALVAASAILGWAWADGGREPLREIAEPIAVPDGAR